jgi:polysaccharide biosynthesis PFTS motif protein
MRGYKRIREIDGPTTIVFNIAEKVLLHPLGEFRKSNLFGEQSVDIDTSLRQYLKRFFGSGSGFVRAIMYAKGGGKKLRYPLPKVWRGNLADDIEIDELSCKIGWACFVFLLWGCGVVRGIKQCYFTLFMSKKLDNYVYFDGLKSNNLPASNKFSYNIIEWYLTWIGRTHSIDNIIHTASEKKINYKNIDISNCPNAAPRLTIVNRLIFVIWFIYICFYSFFLTLFGRYQYGILLNEIILVKLFKLAKKRDLAKDYLFHNSLPIYRPLWTYEAERKGSRVLFYFYSQGVDRYGLNHTPYHLMTWSHYLVWTNSFARFLDKHIKYKAKKEVVGPIWFVDNDTCLPEIENNTIAVFDIPTGRSSIYSRFGLSRFESYVNTDSLRHFLVDICLVAKENNYFIAHKCKRHGRSLHPGYLRVLKDISKEVNYISIEPDSSAIKLIKATDATISMAFTSTATIADSEDKPSVYYDPTGLIDRNDVAGHGVQVLIGIDELKDWFKALKQVK